MKKLSHVFPSLRKIFSFFGSYDPLSYVFRPTMGWRITMSLFLVVAVIIVGLSIRMILITKDGDFSSIPSELEPLSTVREDALIEAVTIIENRFNQYEELRTKGPKIIDPLR